jgi:hypothetical protein
VRNARTTGVAAFLYGRESDFSWIEMMLEPCAVSVFVAAMRLVPVLLVVVSRRTTKKWYSKAVLALGLVSVSVPWACSVAVSASVCRCC